MLRIGNRLRPVRPPVVAGAGLLLLLVRMPNSGLELALALAVALRLGELLVQRALGVVRERERGLAGDGRRRLEAHLLALEIALERVEEEPVVRHGEPAMGSEARGQYSVLAYTYTYAGVRGGTKACAIAWGDKQVRRRSMGSVAIRGKGKPPPSPS